MEEQQLVKHISHQEVKRTPKEDWLDQQHWEPRGGHKMRGEKRRFSQEKKGNSLLLKDQNDHYKGDFDWEIPISPLNSAILVRSELWERLQPYLIFGDDLISLFFSALFREVPSCLWNYLIVWQGRVKAFRELHWLRISAVVTCVKHGSLFAHLTNQHSSPQEQYWGQIGGANTYLQHVLAHGR